jgi:hypothetical protein
MTNGAFSGFQPVGATTAAAGNGAKGKGSKAAAAQANGNSIPVFTMPVASTNPVWIYCSQAQHCQSGMVMAINPPASVSCYFL